MYKAVIFDFFGVFCSSIATDWFKKIVGTDSPEKLAAFQGICTQSDLGKITRDEFNREASRLSGIPVEEVVRGIDLETHLNISLIEYTRILIDRGFRIACLSNGTKEWTLKVMVDSNLTDLFEEITLSADLGIVKPDPEIYQYTLKRLALPAAEVVFVDDRQANVDAAEALGIRSLLFTDVYSFISDFEQLVKQ